MTADESLLIAPHRTTDAFFNEKVPEFVASVMTMIAKVIFFGFLYAIAVPIIFSHWFITRPSAQRALGFMPAAPKSPRRL